MSETISCGRCGVSSVRRANAGLTDAAAEAATALSHLLPSHTLLFYYFCCPSICIETSVDQIATALKTRGQVNTKVVPCENSPCHSACIAGAAQRPENTAQRNCSTKIPSQFPPIQDDKYHTAPKTRGAKLHVLLTRVLRPIAFRFESNFADATSSL